jgi:hypothetical protein
MESTSKSAGGDGLTLGYAIADPFLGQWHAALVVSGEITDGAVFGLRIHLQSDIRPESWQNGSETRSTIVAWPGKVVQCAR